MLDGKLRIAPTCYHVLHLLPVMAAHEMNFFYDAGLKTADGSLGYQILRDAMVPFGLEKLGISQAMKEKSIDIALDVQSRTVFFQRSRGADVYIIAGWRNQHTVAWVGPPHIKSLQDLKGKRVSISDFNSLRHWGIQIQLRKAGLDIRRNRSRRKAAMSSSCRGISTRMASRSGSSRLPGVYSRSARIWSRTFSKD